MGRKGTAGPPLRFASVGLTLSFKIPGLRTETNKVTGSQDYNSVGRLTPLRLTVLEAISCNRIVIPTGAKRGGGTCGFSSSSHANNRPVPTGFCQGTDSAGLSSHADTEACSAERRDA
jgi:hypothetical protein